MKGSAKRKCLCCGYFFPPDHRNVRHQHYCSKPACRKESKSSKSAPLAATSREPKLLPRPGKPPACQRLAQSQSRLLAQKEVFQTQVAYNEELNPRVTPDALQDLFSMQPAMVVGLISMMTGSALQEDIASTVGVLVRKGRDILDMNPGSETTRPYR